MMIRIKVISNIVILLVLSFGFSLVANSQITNLDKSGRISSCMSSEYDNLQINWNQNKGMFNQYEILDSTHRLEYNSINQMVQGSKSYYSYNEWNHLRYKLIKRWSSYINTYYKAREYKYLYDYDNLKLQIREINFNDNSIDTISGEIYDIEYTDFNSIQKKTFYRWQNTKSSWELYSTIEYHYNENQLLSSEKRYIVPETGVELEKYDRTDYFYTNESQLDSSLYYIKNENLDEWLLGVKKLFDYNQSGLLEEKTQYYFDNQTWYPFYKYNFLYNESSQLIFFNEMRIPVGEPGDWIPVSREDIEYNEDGLKVERIKSDWNYYAERWDKEYRNSWKYDDAGQNTETLYENWNFSSETWQSQSVRNSEYDEVTSGYQILAPSSIFNVSTLDEKIIFRKYFQFLGESEMYLDTELEFFYSKQGNPQIITEPEGVLLNLFPNPTQDFVKVVSKDPDFSGTCQVLDINGRILMTKEIQNHQKLDLSNLSQGMYFVKIVDQANKTNIIKVIKE